MNLILWLILCLLCLIFGMGVAPRGVVSDNLAFGLTLIAGSGMGIISCIWAKKGFFRS